MLFRVVCGSNHTSFKHQGVRTFGNLSRDRKTVIQSRMSSTLFHLNSTGHSASFDDFKILCSCTNTGELMTHESLLISKLKPSLKCTGQLNSSQPSIIYHITSILFCVVCIVLLCTVLYHILSLIYLSIL